MKYLIVFSLTILFSNSAFSQKQNNHWYFGFNAGLDFTSGIPVPIESEIIALEGCATVSDQAGNLLFYTNGLTIWDRDHNIMLNGSGLEGGISSTQAAIIVPLPGGWRTYYVFTTEDQATDGGMYYSVIDMTLNGGLGGVVSGAKNILVRDRTAEKITAVMHENGFDVWIITHQLNSNEFLAYLLTSAGLDTTPVISAIGSFYPPDGHIGPAKGSHRGNKLISAATFHRITELFDFDAATGLLSNMFNINDLFPQKQNVYGFEFSPNDSLLYLSTAIQQNTLNFLVQVNLSSGDLTILNTDTVYSFGTIQLGPDMKIYKANYDTQFLDVIHQPNMPGFDCQYAKGGLELLDGTLSALGLPQFVPLSNYFLSLGQDTILCPGSSLELSTHFPADCDSVSVLWSDSSTLSTLVIDEPGVYWVQLITGCGIFTDTILVLQLNCDPIVHYDLNACASYMIDGSHMDYTEFTPAYPVTLSCGTIAASIVYRETPKMNKHSCTPGVEDSKGMCISVPDICEFVPGHAASLLFEVSLVPDPGSLIRVTGLSFFEKGPSSFNWIDGDSGPNNYPEKFGIRILKNGTEIFREEDLDTKSVWTLKEFNFINNDSFLFSDSALLQVELFPYCPAGNGAIVSAWDIDEIRLYGGCMPTDPLQVVTGKVLTKHGLPIPAVEMHYTVDPAFTSFETSITDGFGNYNIHTQNIEQDLYIGGYKNDDILNGVSILDLVMIQKHLLGIAPFQTYHDYIAADINKSGHVSAVDLIELRKILLGINTHFPRNTSWRFGIVPQDIPDMNINLFKETGICPHTDHDTCSIDFVGIKVGDITGDAHPGFYSKVLETRTSEQRQ